MERHERHSQWLLHHREQIAHESCNILQPENDHSEKSNPGMQRVKIGNGRFGVVVRSENSDEAKNSEDEGESMDDRMGEFQVSLSSVSKTSIHQNC